MSDMNLIVAPVVRAHVESAAFQWAQRDTLSRDVPVDHKALAWVDARLDANLDAIRIAGAAAWHFVIDAFETYPEKGELFVAAFLALETSDMKRLDQAVAFVAVADGGARGLCGAFEWLAPVVTAPVVREWIAATDPVKIQAALAALTAHGADPGDRLSMLLSHPEVGVRAGACRLVAAADRKDAIPDLRAALFDAEVTVRISAACALRELGAGDDPITGQL
jgi:uncharacterized protein (TIGR02270 family)